VHTYITMVIKQTPSPDMTPGRMAQSSCSTQKKTQLGRSDSRNHHQLLAPHRYCLLLSQATPKINKWLIQLLLLPPPPYRSRDDDDVLTAAW